jgi:hypothetical protein
MTMFWLNDDEYDLFYDMTDIFDHASTGGRYTDRWYVFNRSVEVGDTVFVTLRSDVLARGRVVAAEPDDQLCSEDKHAGLSPAYCTDPDMDDEVLYVRFHVDSAPDPENAEPFSLEWLAQ